MAKKDHWVFQLPSAARSIFAKKVLSCFKSAGISQAEFRKLGKTNPKKAEKLKKKLTACLVKKMRGK